MSEILFLTAADINFASSRYRGFWPAKYMRSAEAHVLDHALTSGAPFKPDTKAVVFQKLYYAPLMKFAHDQGLRVIWDVCDPMWWYMPDDCREVLEHTDFITASTQPLLDDLYDFYEDLDIESEIIPDCFDMEHYQDTEHEEYQEGDDIWLIWYGHQNNRFILLAHLSELTRLSRANDIPVRLTIMDGQKSNKWEENTFVIKQEQWHLEDEVQMTAAHHLAFLPSYPGLWGKLKSDNKHVHAGLCGLNVYDPVKPKAPLMKMLTWGQDEIDEGWLKDHDAKLIAKQWEELA